MQVQSSGTSPASGYSAVQSAGRRPGESATAQSGQQDGGVQASSSGNGNSGGNQPVQDPNATRGRIVNITA
jgi:hypothetical protein